MNVSQKDLDLRVGAENFPDVPEPAFAHIVISVNAHSAISMFKQIGDRLHAIGITFAESQKKTQKDFALWPPIVDEWNRLDRKKKRVRGPDSHVPPRHPVFHNTPNFDRKEAIRNARTKQLSRPIGSQGCGFVWNRGRLGP